MNVSISLSIQNLYKDLHPSKNGWVKWQIDKKIPGNCSFVLYFLGWSWDP